VLWDNSEGLGGEGRGEGVGRGVQNGGTYVHPLLIHVDVWEKPLQHCKAIKEYWSGLPLTSPGDLPKPGKGPLSSALQSLALSRLGSPFPILDSLFL